MRDPLADLSFAVLRRRWLVIGAWVAILVICGAFWSRAETVVKSTGFELPETQAAQAHALLNRDFRASTGAGTIVVFRSTTSTVSDPAFRSAVTTAAHRIAHLPTTFAVLTYFNTGDASLVSKDRHTTIALVSFKGSEDDPKLIPPLRAQLRNLPIEHEVTGDLAMAEDTFTASQNDLRRFEIVAIPVLILLLLLVFRTAVAATMPLLLGMCSVTVTTGAIALVGSITDVSVFALNVASMIGLGLGIDFSLIIINRYRQEVAAGFGTPEALARTMATAGRSITFSALTVMLCMLIMTASMHDFMILRSISMGVALVAFTALVPAITLLPAVLGLLGPRIEWLRVVPQRRTGSGEAGTWYRLSQAIMRRPWPWLLGALALLAILAFPARQLSTEVETYGALPPTMESVRGEMLVSSAFGPGRVTPIDIVLQTGPNGVWTPPFLKALRQLTDTVAADPRVQSVQSLSTVAASAGLSASAFPSLTRADVTENPAFRQRAAQLVDFNRNDVAVVNIISRSTQFAASDLALVRDLKNAIVPSMPELSPYRVLVGGSAANSLDFHDTVYGRFPLIVGLVLLTTFIILLMFFQSIALPLKALFMNLATMLATYGVLVVVFQWGWGAKPFGFTSIGMLDIVTPVVLYAILFALSTDYEVFMLSRVKELYHATHDNTHAVAAGLQSVGGTITAAGVILIATFGAFTTASVITLKELGVGLAVGVLLDSTVVRIVMVPATMRLMGGWNWWMPQWLKGIVPELSEGPALVPATAAAVRVPEMRNRPADAEMTQLLVSRPSPPRVGRLEPVGDSVGTDVIILPQDRPLRIGRDASNELQLFDPRISRAHSRIDYANGVYYISDLGSTNGVFVNYERLAPHQRTALQPGDVVRIGTLDTLTFTFLLSGAEQSAARSRGSTGGT